jgi:hypothetical protein
MQINANDTSLGRITRDILGKAERGLNNRLYDKVPA